MGSFDYTCAISGLPIHGGCKVRYFLLTENPYTEERANQAMSQHAWWVPRTFPLRATYDNYGAAENIESGPAREIWLDVLRDDCLTRGEGNNLIHEPKVEKGADLDNFLDAIHLGRVLVHQKQEVKTYKIPMGIPTRKRVSEKLVKAGLTLFKEFGVDGYVVNSKVFGSVRIRYHGLNKVMVENLEVAQKAMGKYATVLRGGQEGPELCVFAAPKVRLPFREPKNKPLLLTHAMVREDVWQALVQMPSGNATTLKHFKDSVEKAYKTKPIENGFFPQNPLATQLIVNTLPSVSGFASHWKKYLTKKVPFEKARDFLNSVAEMLYVSKQLMKVRYLWVPSSSFGPQIGEYEEHAKLLRSYLKIAETAPPRIETDEE